MLSDLHASLRTLVYDRGRIAVDDVEIAFDAPTKAWIGARMRPTLNFFLFDIRENTDLRQTAPDTLRANGRGIHRVPPRRFDLRYLVSALTTSVEDEHLLIWRTLGTLMKHPTLPSELLPEAVRALDIPVTGKIVGPDDSTRPLDVWSALESAPRPSLVYIVTLPLDLELETSAPLVLTRTERFSRVATSFEQSDQRSSQLSNEQHSGAGAPDVRVQIGGRVRDRHGTLRAGVRVSVDGRADPTTITDVDGEFALAGFIPGRVTLKMQDDAGRTTLVPIDIPSDAYDLVTD